MPTAGCRVRRGGHHDDSVCPQGQCGLDGCIQPDTSVDEPRPTWGGVPLERRRILLGMAAIGGFLAVDLGAVAYAAVGSALPIG